jgi:agmatinase
MDAVVAVVGFPTDVNSSYLRGPAKAPTAIRAALGSEAGNTFAESERDLAAVGVFVDVGDTELTESPADFDLIAQRVRELLGDGRRVLALGGDHSITYPIVWSYARRYPALSIVHFDAHPDLYPDFQRNRFSHASPFARILEDGLIGRLVQVGVRTATRVQREVADRYGVQIFGPSRLDAALEELPRGPVYVSLDLDALDPAFAPGLSHREPGGLTVREVLDVLSRIPGDVVGADIVELNPDEDVRGLTATVAAKFAKEFIDRMYADAL